MNEEKNVENAENVVSEDKIREELTEWRENIKTFDELVDFLEDVKEHYNYGWSIAPTAIGQACLAVAYFLSKEFGITEFQPGIVMGEFIRGWIKTDKI